MSLYTWHNTGGSWIKVSVGEKIKKKDWDIKNQTAKKTHSGVKALNGFLVYLKKEIESFLDKCPASKLTDSNIKEKIQIIYKNKSYQTKQATQIYHNNKRNYCILIS